MSGFPSSTLSSRCSASLLSLLLKLLPVAGRRVGARVRAVGRSEKALWVWTAVLLAGNLPKRDIRYISQNIPEYPRISGAASLMILRASLLPSFVPGVVPLRASTNQISAAQLYPQRNRTVGRAVVYAVLLASLWTALSCESTSSRRGPCPTRPRRTR